MKDKLVKLFDSSKAEFLKKCGDIPFIPKGITNAEGLFLWSLIKAFNPELIFESGVSQGRSTEILCRAAGKFKVEQVIAIDKSDLFFDVVSKRLKKYPQLAYMIEDSCEYAKNTSVFGNKRIGCFVDGPKQGKPLENLLLSLKDANLQFLVVHDCFQGCPTLQSVKNVWKQFVKSGFNACILDRTYLSDMSVNDILKKETMLVAPEKVENMEGRCCEVALFCKDIYL